MEINYEEFLLMYYDKLGEDDDVFREVVCGGGFLGYCW